MSDLYHEYTKAVARYAVALARMQEAKRALAASYARKKKATATTSTQQATKHRRRS